MPRLSVIAIVVLTATAVFASIHLSASATSLADPALPLVFNEINADPADGLAGDANGDGVRSAQHDEFIEIVNTGDQPFDLSGWTFANSNTAVIHTFTAGTILAAHQALVLFGGGQPQGNFGGALVQTSSAGRLDLVDSFGTLTLTSPDGVVLTVTYEASLISDQSITRSPDLTGSWMGHLDANTALRFSPGTDVSGEAFISEPANLPPAIAEVWPPDSAVAVPLTPILVVTFSEPVSTTALWVDLICAASGVHSLTALAVTAQTFHLTSAKPFEPGETCTGTVHASEVVDLGQPPLPLAADYQWHFTMVELGDEAPHMAGSVPVSGAAGVPPASTFAITFTEPVATLPGAFHLACTPGEDVPLTISGGPTTYYLTPKQMLEHGRSCTITLFAAQISDLDAADPPDHPLTDQQIYFTTSTTDLLLINEIDSSNLAEDISEFVELYDGGVGHLSLDGLTLVLYDGINQAVYAAFSLDGYETDADGFFLAGTAGLPGVTVDLPLKVETIRGGPAAVAVYAAPKTNFPVGAPLALTDLVDAVVYSATNSDPVMLLSLLLPDQPGVDENENDLADYHSSQRCPNGSGGPRQTMTFGGAVPTPRAANTCVRDVAPFITAVAPPPDAHFVPRDQIVTITFSEEISVYGPWARIDCARSGVRLSTQSTTGLSVTLTNDRPFAYAERCTAGIDPKQISDMDVFDPPDHPPPLSWSFITQPADHMLINELDADSHGPDTAEFIELFDGGSGHTSLDGLLLVLYNGNDDASYRVIDLAGTETDAAGYLVIGNADVAEATVPLPVGTLQNGPDAVALYAAAPRDFPTGTAVTTINLIDALVYNGSGEEDAGLQPLLQAGQAQVNENGRGAKEMHSNQRCPNGTGGQRQTTAYLQNMPTPGTANNCVIDDPPQVVNVFPAANSTAVAPDTTLQVGFSEAVVAPPEAFTFRCDKSGTHTLNVQGGPTLFTLTAAPVPGYGETCTVRVAAAGIHDADLNDPPDTMAADYAWSFTTAVRPVATNILINEVDADTSGLDTAEFIELFDGGSGNTSLDGLLLVFYNGSDDASYRAIDLAGMQTDDGGYFVVGNAAVAQAGLPIPVSTLQNGPDAVALYAAAPRDFPTGTAVTTVGLLDALVYNTDGEEDAGLQMLLQAGQAQVNENGRAYKDVHSNQRCPNGAGGQRRTNSFVQNIPTPGEPNNCVLDDAPQINHVLPAADSTAVALDMVLQVQFSEAVSVSIDAFTLRCDRSGVHELNLQGGTTQYTMRPVSALAHGESCTARVAAAGVHDADANDPPDTMAADYAWSFTTAVRPVATHVLINEVDADTPGLDTAEFIELYDGGAGHTALDGLILVLYNGNEDKSYRVIDLAGLQTNDAGYFVVGNAAVAQATLPIPVSSLQNGPDAVALYAAAPRDFPTGTAVTTTSLIDALVYSSNDEHDAGLLSLLLPGSTVVNEGALRPAAYDSNQRCPNGEASPRTSSGFVQNQPTPGSANNCVLDQPPHLLEVVPAAEAVDVSPTTAVAVSFSEPVLLKDGWLSLSCAGKTVPLTISGSLKQFAATPSEGLLPVRSVCTGTIKASHVTDADGYFDPLQADYAWQFTIGAYPFGQCGDPATLIHELQGLNAVEASALGTITIEAVVTGDFQGEEALGGFFVQEEAADADRDIATSEALFVPDGWDVPLVTEGQVVRLQGSAVPTNGLVHLLDIVQAKVCSEGVMIAPSPIAIPDARPEAQRQGMLVTISQLLAVVDNAELGTHGRVTLAPAAQPVPTSVILPGPAAAALAAAQEHERLILDDGRLLLNPLPLPPYLGPEGTLRAGDIVTQMTGILTPAMSGGFILQPTRPVSISYNPRPAPFAGQDGRLRVTFVDAGLYFNGDGRGDFSSSPGAESAAAFQRQREKLIEAILALDGDIIPLTGLENDGDGSGSAVRDLLEGLNAAVSSPALFAAVRPETASNPIGTAPAILYRADRVTPSGLPGVPSLPHFEGTALPVRQAFTSPLTGHTLTLVLVELTARDLCPAAGSANVDRGDGQGCWNERRAAQTAALVEWLSEEYPPQNEQPLLLLGEFNAYRFEDPLHALESSGLYNLTDLYLEQGSYDRLENGRAGSTRYGFASSMLAAQVVAVEQWHHNAAESPALDYRLTNPPALYQSGPYRAAARDALIIDLAAAAPQAAFTTNSPQPIGQEIRFANAAGGPRPLSFAWDFGDGTPESTTANPVHLYTAVGDYTVTLHVTTAWGETAVHSDTVRIDPARLLIPFNAAAP
jgi:predicted extracellular nuclease